uniref:hypothetical protein n=1 Tax=Phenylobacterium sp. TaxID=1871053 RepID=UPI00286BDDA7
GELDHLADHDGQATISDYFLWDAKGAVKRLAAPRLVTEAAEINSETIKAYPMWFAMSAIRNSVRQLFTFQVDDDINIAPTEMMIPIFRMIGDELPQHYLNSAQSRGQFPLSVARALLSLGLVSSVLLIGYVAARRWRMVNPEVWVFAYTAAVGVFANSLAIGALSAIHDRYQNRVIWLVPLVALLIVWSAFAGASRRLPSATAGEADRSP